MNSGKQSEDPFQAPRVDGPATACRGWRWAAPSTVPGEGMCGWAAALLIGVGMFFPFGPPVGWTIVELS